LALNKDNQIVLDAGTDMKAFEATRARITKNIPNHSKALFRDSLRQAAAKAWVTGHDD
jgi:hypothetical protein